MVKNKLSKAQVKTAISICRRLYQQRPHNSLFAMHALLLADEFRFKKPIWAKRVIDDCFKNTLAINSKTNQSYAMLKAFGITGRSFKQFHGQRELFIAAIDMMVLVNDDIRVTEAYKTVSRKYPKLGTPDTLRKKLAPMKDILENGEPFPDPFSA